MGIGRQPLENLQGCVICATSLDVAGGEFHQIGVALFAHLGALLHAGAAHPQLLDNGLNHRHKLFRGVGLDEVIFGSGRDGTAQGVAIAFGRENDTHHFGVVAEHCLGGV